MKSKKISKTDRLIVLGLDGACWPLIEPWLDAGDLPNLAALHENGVWGPLTSQYPPVTSPNWRCYATGRNPAKLGVFWWEIVDRNSHTIRHPTAHDYHTQPLWYELAGAGKRTAVLNFPTGYPPAPIPNGYFTAGGPGAKDTGFAYPTEWERTLRSKYDYRVHPVEVLQSAGQVAAHQDEILALMQSRFDVAFDLLADGVDFLHVTLFYINVLQHFCYRDEPTAAGWRLIDRNLGRLRRVAAEEGYNLLLMSDHGCGPVDTVFYVNTWLAQEGYLRTNVPTAAQSISRLGISRERLISIARQSGVAPLLRRIIPDRVQRALPSERGTFKKEAKGDRIDWKNSVAVASGQGPIYLLLSPDDPAYAHIRGEISSKLIALHNPVSGRPLVERVLTREEIYTGPFIADAPDLVFEQGAGVHTSGSIGNANVFEQPDKWAADNVLHGLFLGWGPDFTNGYCEGARIVDLAPTMLHLMGASIPDDVDGRVLSDIFAKQSDAAERTPTFHHVSEQSDELFTSTEEAELISRLTDLGYLD